LERQKAFCFYLRMDLILSVSVDSTVPENMVAPRLTDREENV